jgi:hypothetical protein
MVGSEQTTKGEQIAKAQNSRLFRVQIDGPPWVPTLAEACSRAPLTGSAASFRVVEESGTVEEKSKTEKVAPQLRCSASQTDWDTPPLPPP